MMSKTMMMDLVIRVLGFENYWTIWFFGLCENPKYSDLELQLAMRSALAHATDDED